MARVDRYGEPIDAEIDTEPAAGAEPAEHRCRRGWIDRDSDHPRPCLICKPWLDRTNTEETTP